MLPWAIALAVVAVAIGVGELTTVRARRRAGSPVGVGGPGATSPVRAAARVPGGRVLSVVLAVLAVVVATGSVVTVYRIGDSGARAAWTGRFSELPQPPLLPAGRS